MSSVLAHVCAGTSLVNMPYSMSFEESEAAEAASWVLNNREAEGTYTEEWIIGEEMHSEGKHSLYISRDGVTARFDSARTIMYAYRDIEFPADGFYDISYDYYAAGCENATLNVGLCLASHELTSTNKSGVLPASLNIDEILLLKNAHGATAWQHASHRKHLVAGREYRLYFAWTNSNEKHDLVQTVSAAIDNVQITSCICAAPVNLTATELSCGELNIHWQGSSSMYQFEYRNAGEQGQWTPMLTGEGGASGEVHITNLKEGTYDFRVRGICTPDTSSWAYLTDYLVFCPENRCINFVDLHNPAMVTCTYGTTDHAGYDVSGQHAYDNIGVIDYGPDKEQRHKVIWDRNATDPRTGNKLKQVSPRDFASVRLGNWEVGRGAESVKYRYVVDEDNPILLLNYAIVMEDPKHSANEQPRFVLEVLNQEGELIDPQCGYCNFAADATRGGWKKEGIGINAVTWKDWTITGLDLSGYVGEEVQVRVTTYDCFESQHYGYAYFSFGCAKKEIEVIGCASSDSVVLAAPEGFSYIWTKSGKFLSTSRTLKLNPDDSGNYTCLLTNMENGCSFQMHATIDPTMPMPDYEYHYEPADCKNIVRFTNKSFTRSIHDYEDITDIPGCETYLWDFGYAAQRSTEKDPVFTFPAEGGKFTVRLTAGIGNGGCESVYSQVLDIPAIGDIEDERDTVVCMGSVIEFGEQLIGRAGHYEFHLKTAAGCDSLLALNITVAEPSHVILPDTTVCSDETFYFGGHIYEQPQTGTFRLDTVNMYGCDSTVVQYVEVQPAPCHIVCLGLELGENQLMLCDNVSEWIIPLIIDSGDVTTYSVHYSDLAHAAGFVDVNHAEADDQALTLTIPSPLEPGEYKAEVIYHTPFEECEDITKTVTIVANYPSSVLFIRWDQLVSLKNAEAAGYNPQTYVFDAYQWLLNGEPIEAATRSYYYREEGLIVGGEYSLRLWRHDGAVMETCPIIIEGKNEAAENTNEIIRKELQNGQMHIIRENVVYDIFGNRK